MNLCDIKTIKQVMSIYGLTFRKEFGQNFLTDKLVVEDIAELCCEGQSKNILEIGPGIGTLTYELAARYENVLAVELDRGLIPVLAYTLGEYNNVKIINDDIMKCDIAEITAPYLEGGLSVCANLPYYITTPILMALLESKVAFDYITVMVQSEVADRLCAAPGSRDCGAITAVLAYYGTAERLMKVPAGKFLPPPKVDSAVVRIKLHKDKPYAPKNEEIFFRTIRAAFGQRRKTLPNALAAGFGELTRPAITEAVTATGLDVNIRGERLTMPDFVALSDKLTELIAEVYTNA
ncbi:MAG: 16S rRNA (adenine(1518)-N(6)/adenine(1519)-N(6))-dimethyltransferase RsmA [Clostridia bacterium]|nr:16S rRNA (adenine(1518)-N(6)/adenine(1519)-N(6))-dimethyltransferase RsmA [Clostridia bacterium]